MPTPKNYQSPSELVQFESDPRPTWIFDIENRVMWWANEAGLRFWKADTITDLGTRDFKNDSVAAIERLNDLATSLSTGETARDSWTLFPRNEPIKVSLDQTLITIESGRQAVLFQVVQFLDSLGDQQSLRLAEATRHTPVLVCLFDVDGHLLTENPAAVKFRTGLERTLTSTRTLKEHTNDAKIANDIIEQVLKDDTYLGERQEPTREGLMTLAMTATRGRDPVTGEIAIYLTEENITEQVQLTQQLAALNKQLENRVTEKGAEVEQRQAWYKSLFEHADDALLIRDVDTAQIVAANPAAAEMFGVSREDLLENRFDPRRKKIETDAKLNRTEPVPTKGLDPSLANGLRTSQTTFYRSDGQPFPALITLVPFPDPHRKLIRTSIVDLSERQQEQARYQAIFNSAAEAIMINDINDQQGFVEMNPQAERLFGVTLDDLQSGRLNFYDLSPEFQPDGRDSKKVAPIYTQSALKHGSSVFEWTFLDVNGNPTPCEMTITPFPHPTKTLIRSSIVDISERKNAEAMRMELEAQLTQAQKLEAVGQLTEGVAHDFNNLLAVILGNMELLQGDVENEASRSLIDRAIEATERGARLTRSMLAFARKSDLSPEQVDLSDAVIDLESWVGNTIADNISVVTDINDDLWTVHVDLAGVERTLLNLVINARDAMPEGGSLTIRASNFDLQEVPNDLPLKPGPHVTLSVIDDGMGVDPETLSRVFDPFFTTKQTNQNSGLGLSMVHGFMTQSGGAVGIESDKSVGTTITLYFPVTAVDANKYQDKNPEELVTPQTLKILLVEDQETVLEVLAKILRAEGHDVTPAISGDHAMDIFDTGNDYDLLITDIDMPGELQGPQLAKKLIERDADLPVIFLSGHNVDIDVEPTNIKTQRLMKPISRQGLITAIAQSVE